MGTNYYHRTNICECCNRFDEKYIGKSSAGWQFYFEGYREHKIESFEDWKTMLKCEGLIFDEYGREVKYATFIDLIASKQKGLNHYDECEKNGELGSFDWKDSEGYSFSNGDFC